MEEVSIVVFLRLASSTAGTVVGQCTGILAGAPQAGNNCSVVAG